MTPQEIFNTVAKHLITQGKPARNEKHACLYRTEHGLKCAVGCLIPDDVYSPQMEDHTASQLLADFPVLDPLLGAHVYLLMDLQAIHDGNTPRPTHEIFGWDVDRGGEASELLRSITNEDETTFNVPKLMRALTFVAYKHNLNPEVVSQ